MIIKLENKTQKRGDLIPIDLNLLSFQPKRFFFVKNVPKNEVRGNHAHFETKQYLICIKGEILVSLYDGFNNKSLLLKEDEMIFVDNMIWDSQKYCTGQDILLSICSTEYNKLDYISDIEKFEKIVKASK